MMLALKIAAGTFAGSALLYGALVAVFWLDMKCEKLETPDDDADWYGHT